MNPYLDEINAYLSQAIKSDNILQAAMNYAVMQKGKRIRPALFLAVLQGFGHHYSDYLDIACALEIMHISTLVHDDLPEIDDDDYRRGELTCHKKFGHGIGLFAGDALMNKSYQLILNSRLDSELKVKIASRLCLLIGDEGLLLGQVYDLQNDLPIEVIYQLKTGNLILLPFLVACILSGKDEKVFYKIGRKLGMAFQIQDDLLDMDEENISYIQKNGIIETKKKMKEFYEDIIELIDQLQDFNPIYLKQIIIALMNRIN